MQLSHSECCHSFVLELVGIQALVKQNFELMELDDFVRGEVVWIDTSDMEHFRDMDRFVFSNYRGSTAIHQVRFRFPSRLSLVVGDLSSGLGILQPSPLSLEFSQVCARAASGPHTHQPRQCVGQTYRFLFIYRAFN